MIINKLTLKTFALTGFLFIGSFYASAQKELTLEEALLIAFDNSPDIKKIQDKYATE